MTKKVRLTVFLVNNIMFIDMEEESAKKILEAYTQFRKDPGANPDNIVTGLNFLIVLRFVTAMIYSKIKKDPTEKWKEGYEEDEDD